VAKLTVIVGIAGSGKSSLCADLAQVRNVKVFEDATLVNSDRRRAGYDCLGELVARLLGCKEDCIMEESHLTMEQFRNTFKKFCDEHLRGVTQDWIFFKNDPVRCINNVFHDMYVEIKERDHSSRLRALLGQIEGYVVPAKGEFPGHDLPRDVFQLESPTFTEKHEALDWLRKEISRLPH